LESIIVTFSKKIDQAPIHSNFMMSFFKTINTKEWIFVGRITAIVIVLTTLPFLYGFFNAPENTYYLGVHSLSPGDYSVYFSYIHQFNQGNTFFRDLFTHESTSYNIVNTFWIFVGIIGKIFHTTPFWAFQAARVLSIPILLISLYLLISYFFQDKIKRKLAFLFLCFSTGVGAYFIGMFTHYQAFDPFYYHMPMDLWVAESNIFLSMLHSGHMVLSWALTVLIFLLSLIAIEKQRYTMSIFSGFLTLVLLSFHPFQAPIVFGVLFVYIVILSLKYKKILSYGVKHFLILIFFSMPILLYYYLMLNFDLITIQRNVQNSNFTTAGYLLILSYGFLFIFALIGIYLFIKNKDYKDDKKMFIIIWLVVQTALIFSPLHYQRRLIEGLQIPIVFLSLSGILYFYSILKNKIRNRQIQYVLNNKIILLYIFLVLFCASNIFVLSRDIALYSDSTVYISSNKAESMLWMKENIDLHSVILASESFIPAISGRAVYIGHRIETINYYDKERELRLFFAINNNDDEKIVFLRHNKISHIFYGSNEKSMGKFSPEQKEYLQKIYENEEVQIYEVVL